MSSVTSGTIIGPAEEKSGEEVVAHVRASLPFHPDRHALNENAKAMSLQFMHDKHRQSFDHMFGRIVGRPRTRTSVRIHKLLNSVFEPDRPIIRFPSSDFCEKDSVDGNGETVVHWSCRTGEVERLQQYLADGFCLRKKNKKGESPLHVASFAGNSQCCQILAMKGADVNDIDEDGWGALHWAVEQNNLQCVKTLITHKADIDLQLSSGKTPLDIALSADAQAVQMMKLLQEQEQSGIVTIKCNSTVNKALSRFLKGASRGDNRKRSPGANLDDCQIPLAQGEPKFRHLVAAQQKGRRKLVIKTLLNEFIQRKLFVDTDAIKRLIQGDGHAAMVYLLRSCDASTHQEAQHKLAAKNISGIVPTTHDAAEEMKARVKQMEKPWQRRVMSFKIK